MGRFLWHGLIGAQGSLDGWEWTQGWIPGLPCWPCYQCWWAILPPFGRQSSGGSLAFQRRPHGLCSHGSVFTDSTSQRIHRFLHVDLWAIGHRASACWNSPKGIKRTLKHRQLEGLWRRAPRLAACLMLLVLSLAGIPPLVGFIAKFNLFIAALNTPHQTLGLIGLVVLV